MKASDTSTRARGGEPRRLMVSRVPRAAGLPYSAQAIASSRVLLPEPLGPTTASIPGPSDSSVRSCWRKFWRERWSSCISALPFLALDLGEQRHSVGDELVAIDSLGESPASQVLAQLLAEGATRRTRCPGTALSLGRCRPAQI